MRAFKLLILLLFASSVLQAKTLEIGTGFTYQNLNNAAKDVAPGDTILFHKGQYTGNQFLSNLQGEPSKWIYITTSPGDEVIISGGGYSWMLSDPAYIRISGFIFERQTGNGMNIDDAGTFDTPAHNIIIENCIFRDINATGNNDLLKLSGVDSILVSNCLFINGAAGGSMIDMVGCHFSDFRGNIFRNAGSNCIQTKGGSQNITIERNIFINGGQRSLNIGGSTGIQYFRPQGVDFEASNIFAYSNIFYGSTSPVAFVGAVYSEVINNTIITPDKWVVRILQETTLANFKKCQNNTFANNIVYINNKGISENGINIGSNTEPETFIFTNNLWYNYENPNWKIPNSSIIHLNTIFGLNPKLTNISDSVLTLTDSSPAIGMGIPGKNKKDFQGKDFKSPPSIGAYEYYGVSSAENYIQDITAGIFPLPASDFIKIKIMGNHIPALVEIYNFTGIKSIYSKFCFSDGIVTIDIGDLEPGCYSLKIFFEREFKIWKFIKI